MFVFNASLSALAPSAPTSFPACLCWLFAMSPIHPSSSLSSCSHTRFSDWSVVLVFNALLSALAPSASIILPAWFFAITFPFNQKLMLLVLRLSPVKSRCLIGTWFFSALHSCSKGSDFACCSICGSSHDFEPLCCKGVTNAHACFSSSFSIFSALRCGFVFFFFASSRSFAEFFEK